MRGLWPAGQIGREFQAAAEQQFTAAAAAANGDPEVNHAIGIGEEDVAEAAAGFPEAFGNRRQFAIVAFGHQGRHVRREQQTEIPGEPRVAHAHIRLNAVEGKEADARHHQAHHQGGCGEQFGLQAEFSPPAGQPLPQAHRLRTW